MGSIMGLHTNKNSVLPPPPVLSFSAFSPARVALLLLAFQFLSLSLVRDAL